MNDKISKSRLEYKNLRKDLQNLRDSNENHIFINDKLNHALKKANSKMEELELKLQQYETAGDINNSKKSTGNSTGESE
jgi:hypothetical protein